jgi:hypothetical protein
MSVHLLVDSTSFKIYEKLWTLVLFTPFGRSPTLTRGGSHPDNSNHPTPPNPSPVAFTATPQSPPQPLHPEVHADHLTGGYPVRQLR